jgi:serine/threonine protein kinase
MREMLKPNQTVSLQSGSDCRVIRFLGSGGQGEVYEVELSGQRFALKWYYSESATSHQYTAITNLIRRGRPSPSFLWPIEITNRIGSGFGYIMPLREKRFASMIDIVRRKVEPSFRSISTVGYRLADSFLDLHSKGFCYCDISWGNVFLDPVTGDIAICDNDNVIPAGEKPAILGTPDFIAPEVVRQEKDPSGETDKFSLAVLLFYLFYIDHPLKGQREANIKCFDLDARALLFGREPIYIFDPLNSSNRPVPGIHDNAIAFQKVYPGFLKKKFEQSFTHGLSDKLHARVTENEWKLVMARLYDSIYYCSYCTAENFYDSNHFQQNGGKPADCWACKMTPVLPFRIRFDKAEVMLNHDTKLLSYHLGLSRDFEPQKTVASVSRHPKDQSVWGLRNETSSQWIATPPNEAPIFIDPGRNVKLAAGTRIAFGKLEGEICY